MSEKIKCMKIMGDEGSVTTYVIGEDLMTSDVIEKRDCYIHAGYSQYYRIDKSTMRAVRDDGTALEGVRYAIVYLDPETLTEV